MRILRWAALGLGVVALVLRPPFALVRLIAVWRRDIVFHIPGAGSCVALTLDDGPHPVVTGGILDVLARHSVRATFFAIGDRAQCEEELLSRMHAEGHEIGNHLWHDERAAALSEPEFEAQLLRTHAVLTPIAPPRLFRPGSGFIGRAKVRIAAGHGYLCVLGSIYPYDAHFGRRPRIINDVLRRVRPGAIVILHEGTPARSDIIVALDRLLAGLRARGYEVVPVGELLRRGQRQD